MSSKKIDSATLTNTKFGHSKEYEVTLLEEKGEFFITSRWGKIGGTKNQNNLGPFEKAAAEKKYRALLAAKKADGYVEVGQPEKDNDETGIPLFYPMKAAEADPEVVERRLDDPDWIAERKFDGARYLLKIFPDGTIKLHSRKASVKDNLPVDKTANVPHLIKEAAYLSKVVPGVGEGTVLDGEILWDLDEKGGEITDRMVTSVMGALPDKAIQRQEQGGYVYMMVYDLPWFNGKSMFDVLFAERRVRLEHIFNKAGLKYISPVQQVQQDKRAFLESMWQEGKEGIILKDPRGLYQPGERPKDTWVKVKKQLTDEFVIMDFVPGEGKYKGLIGAIVFGQHDRLGKLVKVSQCSGFSDEERKRVTANPKKFIGQVIEVEFQQRTKPSKETPGGSLRHPRWYRLREDKNARECVLP